MQKLEQNMVMAREGHRTRQRSFSRQWEVFYHVEFDQHGKDLLSGHGHPLETPGIIHSGHGPDNHIPHNQVPPEYQAIPEGVQYSTPIGQGKYK